MSTHVRSSIFTKRSSKTPVALRNQVNLVINIPNITKKKTHVIIGYGKSLLKYRSRYW